MRSLTPLGVTGVVKEAAQLTGTTMIPTFGRDRTRSALRGGFSIFGQRRAVQPTPHAPREAMRVGLRL